MRAKLCSICNEEFIPKHSAQKLCGKDHYSICPICGKKIIWNSTRNPKPCSNECSAELRRRTTYERYHVTNVMQLDQTIETRRANQFSQVKELLPLRLQVKPYAPLFRIDESTMSIYVLREIASITFLKNYGHRIKPKFAKKHLSIGLVQDGILYQVLRFEMIKGRIILADFGTRSAYFNPNYYNKLMRFAICVKGIDSFSAAIPRELANEELLKSLSVKKVSDGQYKVFWMIDEKLVELTQRNDIQDMLSKYDYVTTDYLDEYEFDSSISYENKEDEDEVFMQLSGLKVE